MKMNNEVAKQQCGVGNRYLKKKKATTRHKGK
jgi:hypothetical protein